jgi:hypothetical protein
MSASINMLSIYSICIWLIVRERTARIYHLHEEIIIAAQLNILLITCMIPHSRLTCNQCMMMKTYMSDDCCLLLNRVNGAENFGNGHGPAQAKPAAGPGWCLRQ